MNTATRKEHDLLGEVEIPADAYYGIHSYRAMNNFNISSHQLKDYPDILKSFAMVKKACALTSLDFKIIEHDVAIAISNACDKVINSFYGCSEANIDLFQGGAGTSTNMCANEIIANIALEILGKPKGSYNIVNPMDHVNLCQSTNDSYPTSLRLTMYSHVLKVISSLQTLISIIKMKANEFSDVIKMGRTQLQDAIPMSLGDEFLAFADLLLGDVEALNTASKSLLQCSLGGTAIGNGLNAPIGYNSKASEHLKTITGWDIKPINDLICACSDTGDYILVHSVLKRLSVHLGKVCNDLRLLSSGPRSGIHEINLPERQAGSSIMPCKINPVIPEVVNQVCFKVIGNDIAITAAGDSAQLQLNVMEPVMLEAFLESTTLLCNAMKCLGDKCVSNITANKEACRDMVMNSIGLVTFFNPYIGHANGDLVGRRCAKEGKRVDQVVLEMGLLSQDEVNKILDENNLARPKTAFKIYE